MDALNDTVNGYIPDAQQALDDTKSLNTSAQSGIKSAQAFLRALEELLKKSGSEMDAGLEKTLSGLADSLRESTKGLDETDSIRDAKDAIKKMADDEWNDHTGKIDNLLNMDASARPVSLTSVSTVLPQACRSSCGPGDKGIGSEEGGGQTPQNAVSKGNFFSRVVDMFRDIWLAVVGCSARAERSLTVTFIRIDPGSVQAQDNNKKIQAGLSAPPQSVKKVPCPVRFYENRAEPA
jgi:putative membrane protein